MKEDFLHYVWKFGLFSGNSLATTVGQPVLVKSFGQHNMESGPDFFNARVVIGETEWAGNVEIHLKSSDWNLHGHSNDSAYDNVVLHVVFEDDAPVEVQGKPVPTLELKSRISLSLLRKYQQLQVSSTWVPCQTHLNDVSKLEWGMVKDRLLAERMERKADEIALICSQTGNNWFETLYRLSSRYFGQPQNGLCFQAMTQQLPFATLARHADNSMAIEALLFGVAGLIPAGQDDHTIKLGHEFQFLKRKYGLETINIPWKFGRMRPAALPTIRIALFASFVVKLPELHAQLVNGPLAFGEWLAKHRFRASAYWDTHYVFGKQNPSKAKHIGEALKNSLLINVFAPYLFHYGRKVGNVQLSDQAMEMLHQAAPEANKITRQWEKIGATSAHAADSQSLIELKSNYCDHKKCVLCGIGNSILKKSI